ncbi:translation initiation factor IF-2 [bacterium]|jgi:translation initiation factor IF-2|nr:translation initiation factor IF-2 [bacterium]MBT3730124.1 translation initiation factor IF-2 [bacterium]MBT4895011.1 translation initiation factor IF-2 [bacterium]
MTKEKSDKKIQRSPVIVVMGHIDHGKSALLDYIRKTKIVESESGGITQHISAYELTHKDRKITFLDTPGHEAFKKMRSRGAEVADIAILVVSAEEGVKAQTLEALKCIRESKTPFIVAINKIDKPAANVEKIKTNLSENEIYLEGLGGDVPFVPVSAKTGEGIPELLDMMLLVADLEELSGDTTKNAEGIVIESNLDQKKGISASLVIKDGTLKSGMFVVAGDSMSPVRIMEDFQGLPIKEASFSSPIRIVGFSKVPQVGAKFSTFDKKKDAEKATAETNKEVGNNENVGNDKNLIELPIVLVADVLGTLDAIEHEFEKLKNDSVEIRIIKKGVGCISEDDIKTASGNENTLVVGFNTKIDGPAQSLANRLEIEIKTFDIIYKITEWLEEVIKERTPKVEVEEKTGEAKILRIFSKTKDKQVLGGRVLEGEIALRGNVNILRRGENIGKGVIVNLQQSKANIKHVSEGEFGAQIQTKTEISEGDTIEGFVVKTK